MAETGGVATGSDLVDRDWPCMKCGYNLRTLWRSGNCPECGFVVWESLKTSPLHLADPVWARRIRNGIAAMLIGVTFHILFTELQYWVRLNRGPLLAFSIAGANGILKLAWPLSLLPAALLLRRGEAAGDSPRWPGRFLLIAVISHLLFLALAIAIRIIWWGGWNPAFNFAMDVQPIFLVPEIWFVFRIVESLVERIPDKPMLAETRLLGKIFCLVLFLQAAAMLCAQVMGWRLWPKVTGWPQWGPWILHRSCWSLIEATYPLLRMLWIYLPIFLLRFFLHIRRSLTA